MAEEKKQKKVEHAPVVKEKKKSNTLLYVIIGIVVFLMVLAVAAFLVVRGLVKKGVSVFEDETERIERQIEEDFEITEDEDGEETWMFSKSTEEEVDGELEREDLITDRFPEDIPLPGGIVTASSYDDYSLEIKLDINSSVEEIMDWFEEALAEEGWEITSRSSQESMEEWVTGTIQFSKEEEERKGRIDLDTNPYQEITSVRIRELLW
jgi:hypothetical protein